MSEVEIRDALSSTAVIDVLGHVINLLREGLRIFPEVSIGAIL